MKMSDRSRCSFGVCVAALLAGCGGLERPIGAPGATPQSVAARAKGSFSHELKSSTNGDLIYITPDGLRKAFYIFTYPAGDWVANVKTSYYPTGACADGNGNVFITGNGAVYEYAHGDTTPSRTLTDPGNAQACAVDPTTHNLAVTNFGSQSEPGDIAIYTKARGAPTNYVDPEIQYLSTCGYDNRGNLFGRWS